METMEREKLARLIHGGRWAALATYGDGVPLASMVAYACEVGFAGFLLHLSRLSAHTRNLLASPSASIAISEPDTTQNRDPQILGRVSIQVQRQQMGQTSLGVSTAVYSGTLPRTPKAKEEFIGNDAESNLRALPSYG